MKILTTIISCLFLLTACNNKEESNFAIDSRLPTNAIYKKLNHERDTKERYILDAVPSLKTSDVTYLSSRDKTHADSAMARTYNCSTYLKADTLQIDIGRGTGYGGKGFVITCLGNEFTIKPYYSTNVIDFNKNYKTASVFNTIEQYLTLDKARYIAGDSIFGKVKFKIIEHEGGQKMTHTAEGYFRSKVVGL